MKKSKGRVRRKSITGMSKWEFDICERRKVAVSYPTRMMFMLSELFILTIEWIKAIDIMRSILTSDRKKRTTRRKGKTVHLEKEE